MSELRTQGVSVVMPVYNGERFLEETIESVLAQTHRYFEFLILDDGSTDGTDAIVARFKDSRIKLVRNPRNLGLTSTLNRGLSLAHFELIARHDADDISHPERLAKQIGFFIEHPEVVLVGTQAEIVDEQGRPQGQLFDRAQTHESIVWDLLFDNGFTHSSVMFKKSVILNELGGYDESVTYCQDYHLWSEVARCHRVANLPDRLVSYRIHPYSRMSDTMYDAMISENQSIVKKNLEALLGRDSITQEDVEAVVGVRLAFEARFLPRTIEIIERSILRYGSQLNKESLGWDFQETIARRYVRVAYKTWLTAPFLVFRVLWFSIWRYPVIKVCSRWFENLVSAITRHRLSQITMRES